MGTLSKREYMAMVRPPKMLRDDDSLLTPVYKSMEKTIVNTVKLIRIFYNSYLFCMLSLNSSLQNQKLANKIVHNRTTNVCGSGAVFV